MKPVIILCILLSFSCGSSTSPPGDEYQLVLATATPDPVLKNIQQKINQAFVTATTSEKIEPLDQLDQQLSNLKKTNTQNLITYWRAYLHFYQSIFYLGKMDQQKAERAIDQAINWMDDLEKKNSEDHALLAMLRGFSIQFKSGMKAPFINNKSENDAIRSVELDSTNLRGWYVSASNDYYTPEKYGGGKKVEKYLSKALACPDQKIKNEYLPSWGRDQAYEMLIKFYIKKEDWGAAKKAFSEANEKLPNSYIISQLAKKLVGK